MRLRLALLAAGPLLVACGSHQPAADVAHPTGHRDVVLRLTDGPGMGTAQTFFSEPPVLVVAGDGTSYLRGEEVTAQGIVWPMFRYDASEADLQALLHEADRDGLLAAPPDYSPPSPIADGGDTRVEITAGGGHWTHVANGLSDATRERGARVRLADFVAFVEGWARTPRKPTAPEIQPTVLRVLSQLAPAPAPRNDTVVRWPARAGVDLAAIGPCAVVRDPVAVHRLTTAGVHYYRQAGRTYEVAAAVLLPGDSCGSDPAS
jgi:hypothetical protein